MAGSSKLVRIEHEVGLADLPLLLRRRGRLRRLREVARRCAGANPVDDRGPLLVGQAAAVHERAELVAGEPRRHPLVGDDLGDRFGPRRGLLVTS